MSVRVEILYRGSSDADGVRSRGAGWHPMAVGRNGAGLGDTLELPTTGLGEGDLVRVHGSAVKLYVLQRHGLRRVVLPVMGGGPPVTPADMEGNLIGDLSVLWDSSRKASTLFEGPLDLSRQLFVAAGCDCAETVLRFAPKGEERPRRAVRVVRRWLAGTATWAEVDKAGVVAREAASDALALAGDKVSGAYYAGTAANAAALAVRYDSVSFMESTINHVAAAADTVYGGDDDSSRAMVRADADRSLAFLVRVRIPAWRVCLATARKGKS